MFLLVLLKYFRCVEPYDQQFLPITYVNRKDQGNFLIKKIVYQKKKKIFFVKPLHSTLLSESKS